MNPKLKLGEWSEVLGYLSCQDAVRVECTTKQHGGREPDGYLFSFTKQDIHSTTIKHKGIVR